MKKNIKTWGNISGKSVFLINNNWNIPKNIHDKIKNIVLMSKIFRYFIRNIQVEYVTKDNKELNRTINNNSFSLYEDFKNNLTLDIPTSSFK